MKVLIDDIVKSFEDMLSCGDNSNPFAGIMGLSQDISKKYANKINNGEIELDKIIKSITSKVPGMDVMMDSMMNYIEESYEGIIPLPVHKEELEYSVYSEDPLIWGEKSELYFEVK